MVFTVFYLIFNNRQLYKKNAFIGKFILEIVISLFLVSSSSSAVITDICSNSIGLKKCRESVNNTVSDVTNQIHFLLYTRLNRNDPQEIIILDDTTIGSFNGSRTTKFIVHGFGGGRDDDWLRDTRIALLDKDDFNVIVVDWKDLAKDPDYLKAVTNTKVVGHHLGNFLDWLNLIHGSSSSNYHLIGFSLGAHVVGFAGSTVSTGKPKRITGLDPAYPFFETANKSERLDKSDGLFVDVIHTNSGPLYEGGLSFLEPLGHVDFYPNGGRRQPECKNLLESIVEIFVSGFDGACSHNRAPQLYIESIVNPIAFSGYPCSDYDTYSRALCTSCDTLCPLMGENVPYGITGIYYLATRATKPFSGKPLFVQFQLSPNYEPTYGWVHLNVTDESGLMDNPLLFNEEQKIGFNSTVYSAADILLDIQRNLTMGTLNFTQHSGGSVLRIDQIKVYDQLTNQSVCFNGPLIAENHTLIQVSFISC